MNPHTGTAPAATRVLRQPLELSREFLWHPEIIGVEKREPLCARVCGAEIAQTRAITGMRFRNDRHASVTNRLEPRDRIVGRTVIDDNQLPVLQRLRQDRRNRLPQQRQAIVSWQNDGNDG